MTICSHLGYALEFELRGRLGEERVKISLPGAVNIVTVSQNWKKYEFLMPLNKTIAIEFMNDNGPRDVFFKSSIPHNVWHEGLFRYHKCGTKKENPNICVSVRNGVLAWQGQYVYLFRPKGMFDLI